MNHEHACGQRGMMDHRLPGPCRVHRRIRQLAQYLHAVPVVAAATPAPESGVLPVITLAEVAQHRTRSSCWVAIAGEVFDFTALVESHPGGARGLLRHAGTDASDVFTELHSQSIFATFAPQHRIGILDPADQRKSTMWSGVSASTRFWEGLPTEQSIVPDMVVLPSPFPHDRFTATGLETFRWNWAQADRLLRVADDSDDAEASVQVPPQDERAMNHMFRQKSSLGVLNIERDWLHVSQAEDAAPELPGYSSEMAMKRSLLLEQAHHTYVTDAAAKDAEAEVLELVIEFVLRRYPTRFALVDEGRAIATLSAGYEHTYVLADWTEEPLKLVGMLVQEDMCVLQAPYMSSLSFNLPCIQFGCIHYCDLHKSPQNG